MQAGLAFYCSESFPVNAANFSNSSETSVLASASGFFTKFGLPVLADYPHCSSSVTLSLPHFGVQEPSSHRHIIIVSSHSVIHMHLNTTASRICIQLLTPYQKFKEYPLYKLRSHEVRQVSQGPCHGGLLNLLLRTGN